MAAFKEAFDAFDWNKSGNISYGSLQVKLEEKMQRVQEIPISVAITEAREFTHCSKIGH